MHRPWVVKHETGLTDTIWLPAVDQTGEQLLQQSSPWHCQDTCADTAPYMQPAAIHGDQFAFSSSLAVFVHASDNYRLLKLLAQQTQHINALCWSPVDAKLIACSNAEKVRCVVLCTL